MTNHDIEYISNALEIAIEGMSNSIDQVKGVSMVIDTANIDVPTIDKAILETIDRELLTAQNLLMRYCTELKARKQ